MPRTLPPDVLVADDPVVCRLRTMIIISTAVVLVAALMITVLGGRPVHAWSYLLVAALALPALRTNPVTVLIGLADLLLVLLLASPGLGGWTNLAVLTVHLAASAWFLGHELPGSAWLHRSALRRIVIRFGWIQVTAQVAVLAAILTADVPDDPVVAGLGLAVVLALALALVLTGHRRSRS